MCGLPRGKAEELEQFDAVVIGSGISGASLARELARFQLRVAVLERSSDVCAGATRGNSATVHSGHDAAFGTKKAYYNVLGNAMYAQLCHELSVPFVRNGTVIFAASEKDMSEVRRLADNAQRNGVPGVEVLSPAGLCAVEGRPFGSAVRGGLYAPTGGMVSPYALAIALCENAAHNGVVFDIGTPVTGIEKVPQGYLIHSAARTFSARFVFNCAGTHADEINDFVSEAHFSIRPRKGEHILLDRKLAPYVHTTVCQTPMDLPGGGHTKGMGIMPTVDGTILLGCDAQDVADKDDTSTTPQGLGAILSYFEENWHHLPISAAVPVFPRGMVIGAFGGLRPHPDTDDFILGEAPDAPGFFNMAGIESPGVTAAPAIAQALAQQAAGIYGWKENPSFDPLRPHEKPFREMNNSERAQAIAGDADYGRIVCRCEEVTRAEVLQAIRGPLGARSVNAVKMRTRAGMGRCQGGFCGPEIAVLLAHELHIPLTQVTQCGPGSPIAPIATCVEAKEVQP